MQNNKELIDKLSTLLCYPAEHLDSSMNFCRKMLKSHSADPESFFERFAQHMIKLSHHEQEEFYTSTFDLTPQAFPYAGYQIYGEDYKRGLLMAGLKEGYAECGIDLSNNLPDFIPLLLKMYTRLKDREKAQSLRDDLLLPGMNKVHEQLELCLNPFRDLFQIIINILEADKTAEQHITGGSQ